MKQLICFFFSFLLVVHISSCGRRTSPKPFDLPEEHLPEIKIISAVFKGETLVIIWVFKGTVEQKQVSDQIISFGFRFSDDLSCFTCQNNNIIQYRLDLRPEKPVFRSSLKGTQQIPADYSQNNGIYTAALKRSWIKGGHFENVLFLNLNYSTQEGYHSKNGAAIRVIDPLPIPTPLFDLKKVGEVEGSDQVRFLLRWNKKQETTIHMNDSDGSLSERIVYYGLNFYQTQAGEQQFAAKPLNEHPLLDGGISFYGQKINLWASYVDRFGNESERVPVITFSLQTEK